MANSNSDSGKSSSGTSAGAIAGGVVGGVAAAAIFGFFVWFFCFSKRAQRAREEKEWIPVVGQDHVTGNHTAGQMPPGHYNQRNSSSTFASLASSALSRASNVIPIAYVPGVTSRGGAVSRDSSTGGTLGSNPPIPDVPWEYQFTPEELLRQSRQSTVYGIRDSVNTEAYRESQAYVSSAMMTAIQAKPMLVNVKDGHVTNNNNARDSALRQSFMSGTSDGSVYEVASAERVNARSIRIGKAQRVGLQSTYISEESEEEAGGAKRDSVHSAAVPIGLDRPTLGRSLTGNSSGGASGVSGVSRKSEVPPLPAALEVTSAEAPQLDENIFAGLDIPVQLITTDGGQESPFDDKFRL